MANKEKKANLKTPVGRVSFPCVFEKSEYSGKYEVTLVFPPGTDLGPMKKAAAAAAKAKFGDKAPAMMKAGQLRNPFRKTDEKPEVYGSDFEPGSVFVGFRSQNRKPQIVDAGANLIMEKDEFYAGCYGRVSCNAYGYNTKGNKGVAFGLVNIQKVKEGEALSASAIRAEDEFEALEGSGDDEAAYTDGDDDIFGDSGDDDTPASDPDDDFLNF